MKKLLLGLLACGCLTKSTAQVSFQLSLMPDRTTYLVSMTPTQTWVYPKNITGTAQVTVRIPANVRFTAGNITSLQQGVKWLDNARVERPAADRTHDYVSFSLTSMATKAIPYQANVETPLFTFTNIQNDCVGKVELVDNAAATTQNVTAEGFNVKNHLSVMAMQGEAFEAATQGSRVADCSATTNAQDLNNGLYVQTVYPTPATDLLTIEWTDTHISKAQNTVLIITNALGQEMINQKIDPLSMKGATNKIDLDVRPWASGVYLFHFVNDKGLSPTQKIVVSK
jgi:hypothetical protein